MECQEWGKCPKCRERELAELAKAEVAHADSYGTASLAEFQMEAERLEKLRKPPLLLQKPPTLIERIDTDLNGGRLWMMYRAECVVCDFKVEYQHGNTDGDEAP